MSTFEAITIMIAFGMFTVSLISLVVMLIKDNNKGKKPANFCQDVRVTFYIFIL